jgi:hypothetical protein
MPNFSVHIFDHYLVLQACALYWEMLPFCLFIGIPLLVLSNVTMSPAFYIKNNGLDVLLTWLLVALLIFMLPEVSTRTRRFSTLIARTRTGGCGKACGFGRLLEFFFASTGRTIPHADDIVSSHPYSLHRDSIPSTRRM